MYIWYFIFCLFQNIFVDINFCTSSVEFINTVGDTPIAQTIVYKEDILVILSHCYQSFLLNFSPQLTGPSWFLYALFMVSVIHALLCYVINTYCKINRYFRFVIWMFIFTCVCVLAWAFSLGLGDTIFLMRHRRLAAAYVCYLLGIGIRNFDHNEEIYKSITVFFENRVYKFIFCLISIFLLTILSFYGKIELSDCTITNPLFLIVSSLLGWVLLFFSGQLIEDSRIGIFLSYVGRHTMSIMILHLIAFKLVSYVLVLFENVPIYNVASYPIIFDVSESVKIIYTVVGVILPIVVSEFYFRSKEIICKKFIHYNH